MALCCVQSLAAKQTTLSFGAIPTSATLMRTALRESSSHSIPVAPAVAAVATSNSPPPPTSGRGPSETRALTSTRATDGATGVVMTDGAQGPSEAADTCGGTCPAKDTSMSSEDSLGTSSAARVLAPKPAAVLAVDNASNKISVISAEDEVLASSQETKTGGADLDSPVTDSSLCSSPKRRTRAPELDRKQALLRALSRHGGKKKKVWTSV